MKIWISVKQLGISGAPKAQLECSKTLSILSAAVHSEVKSSQILLVATIAERNEALWLYATILLAGTLPTVLLIDASTSKMLSASMSSAAYKRKAITRIYLWGP